MLLHAQQTTYMLCCSEHQHPHSVYSHLCLNHSCKTLGCTHCQCKPGCPARWDQCLVQSEHLNKQLHLIWCSKKDQLDEQVNCKQCTSCMSEHRITFKSKLTVTERVLYMSTYNVNLFPYWVESIPDFCRPHWHPHWTTDHHTQCPRPHLDRLPHVLHLSLSHQPASTDHADIALKR